MSTRSRRAPGPAVLAAAALLGVGLVSGLPGNGPAVPMPASRPVASAPAPATCDPQRTVLVPDTPYALRRLGAKRAWEQATGAGVVVAVVDSGVQRSNQHLGDAVLPGTSFVPSSGDGQGWTDATSHGTAVAGIVAAREIPGSGVIGLARDARILPVQVYVSEEQEDVVAGLGPRPDRTAQGIRYAADRGARIIAVPLSTPERDAALDDAVAYATGKGSLVVASAGNREQDDTVPDGPRFPAGSPGALGVGAVDSTDAVSNQSIAGPQVGVVAPGTDVLTTYFAAGDCALEPTGGATSWATGYVAGAAALLAQAYPSETPAQLAYRLEVTADRPVRAARDDQRGWGLIQPLEALTTGLDPNRPGPPLPGTVPRPQTSAQAARIDISANRDPAAAQKSAGGWWLLGGAGLVGLALLGAWARRRRDGGQLSPAAGPAADRDGRRETARR